MPVLSPAAKRVFPLIDLVAPMAGADFCRAAMMWPALPASILLAPAAVGEGLGVWAGQRVRIGGILTGPDVAAARLALQNGAAELDVLLSETAFAPDERAMTRAALESLREVSDIVCLKVQVQGQNATALRMACDLAIDAGADFLCAQEASALPVLCQASRAVGKLVGVKVPLLPPSLTLAQKLLDDISSIMGLGWISAEHVRLGWDSPEDWPR